MTLAICESFTMVWPIERIFFDCVIRSAASDLVIFVAIGTVPES